jgi:hypothetical protein
MEILRLDRDLSAIAPEAVLLVALDGWTDAGAGGSTAAATLHGLFGAERVGIFDPDALYDYRDRRPELEIDRGRLGMLTWPELAVDLVTPPAGPPLVTVTGAEPDLRWQAIGAELRELAERVGLRRYVGLGSVPGPIPHTRPVHVLTTGTDPEALERSGRAHEQVVVPGSCQVVLEKLLGDAGLRTLGLWVRIPHYVAGSYPEAAKTLLERLSSALGVPLDVTGFDREIDENRVRLDLAASSSDEVREHVRQLERLYDVEAEAEEAAEVATGALTMSEEDVPSADELAAEIERFLRGRPE